MKKAIIISGVPLEFTPVTKNMILYLTGIGCMVDSIDISKGKIRFVYGSLRKIFTSDNGDLIIFVNLQCLPLIFLTQFLHSRRDVYYWALESYRPEDGYKLNLKFLWYEKFINWCNVSIILPEDERRFLHCHKYKKVFVIRNVMHFGQAFIHRKLQDNSKLRFILYGSFTQERTYIKEIVNWVQAHNDLVSLDIIGNVEESLIPLIDVEGVMYLGRLSHKDLLDKLMTDYHYSFIGYKPINNNLRYCAPNKLYESMALSLPCILNVNNPTLKRVAGESTSFCVDFVQLSNQIVLRELIDLYHFKNIEAYKLYKEKYNFEFQIEEFGKNLNN